MRTPGQIQQAKSWMTDVGFREGHPEHWYTVMEALNHYQGFLTGGVVHNVVVTHPDGQKTRMEWAGEKVRVPRRWWPGIVMGIGLGLMIGAIVGMWATGAH
jgi:hypothetical protein